MSKISKYKIHLRGVRKKIELKHKTLKFMFMDLFFTYILCLIFSLLFDVRLHLTLILQQIAVCEKPNNVKALEILLTST